MTIIQENVSLKKWNTFSVESHAHWYASIGSDTDLQEIFADTAWLNKSRFILGRGSNTLFVNDFDGLLAHIHIPGITHEIHGNKIYVRAGAGEAWSQLVNYCVAHQFAGVENLSAIPGSVGASTIQNIGAYGVELMDVFHSCKAFEIKTGIMRIFNKTDCAFSYRDSIFKTVFKNKYIITEVTYVLSFDFKANTSYGTVEQELQIRGIKNPSIQDVSQVISHIRASKLPDPKLVGNAGSFFKNPMITVKQLEHLQSAFPDMVYFPSGGPQVKLAAGWLIEQCGWKGKTVGHVGTWKNQALVLVNHGKATGSEIFKFSSTIIQSVQDRFNLILEPEVNIVQ